MKGIISILHISDLHRSKGGEITNRALLSSLINDRDKYTQRETPRIKKPDLIIVSGDVIRGSINPTGSEEEVKGQYDEAIEFLNELTKFFLNGNKNRIIVIPGNHDVDWKFSKESMTKIESSKVFDSSTNNVKSKYLKEAINQHSNIRWNWNDLSFYEITEQSKYKARLEAFANFYGKFYERKRNYSVEPDKQYDIFDIPDFNFTIAAFSSCYCNDHLRLAGDIHPDCIAGANLRLRAYRNKGRLIAATWHHNTKGLPYDFTYMDSSRLKNFIDSGISLGFHGHQHKTELIHEFGDVIEQKKIIIFSAGTLCGGPNELPTGNNRQYNLIEIDWKSNTDTTIDVRLHMREKTDTSPFDNPIWGAGGIDSNLVSYRLVEIEKPKPSDISSILIDIEVMMRNKNYDEAKKQLLNLNLSDDFVRKFLIQCIIETEDFALALKIFTEPKTDEEFITALNSAQQLNDKSKMKVLLELAKKFSSVNVALKEVIKKIEAILK
jgi:predicted phosphodiesterase